MEMWLVTLTHKSPVSVREAEKRLIKKLRELPGRPEHLAVTHGDSFPHHHVWIEETAGMALLNQWKGRAAAHIGSVDTEMLMEYLRGGRLTSFYSSSFAGGTISDSSTSKQGESSDGK